MYVYLMQSAFCYVFVCVRAHVCVCEITYIYVLENREAC